MHILKAEVTINSEKKESFNSDIFKIEFETDFIVYWSTLTLKRATEAFYAFSG
jgi:hypothetical protein